MDVRKKDLPKEWSNLNASEKLDKVMQKLMDIDHIEEKVDRLIDQNPFSTDILLKVSTLEGKNHRLEREVGRWKGLQKSGGLTVARHEQ